MRGLIDQTPKNRLSIFYLPIPVISNEIASRTAGVGDIVWSVRDLKDAHPLSASPFGLYQCIIRNRDHHCGKSPVASIGGRSLDPAARLWCYAFDWSVVEVQFEVIKHEIYTRSHEVTISMVWDDFKVLMREEFCPSKEMKKLETELWKLWNHAMVGTGHAAYTVTPRP
ncbi:hypothetical protein Tco_1044801 [Tanacetum coccineum]|uniref:Uncharacterized protein n=1 Tax=Tanacetum coccineum TaxID=301880 RepID=A0ABQ5GQY4_9ASTR